MKKIACIVKGYPRLSETFIAQEIHALEQAGIDVIIYSLRQPTDSSIHPIHKKIQAKVHYLPEYLYQHPVRVFRALVFAMKNRRFLSILKILMKDFRRDFTSNRLRRFGQALVLSKEIQSDRQWLYVHFLHTPASVAYYASHLTQLPWSCSAHAKDIWTITDWEAKQKLSHLKWLVSCTQSNVTHLKSLSDDQSKVSLLYHGLDLNRFPKPNRHNSFDGSDKDNTVNIISVGRAVNKKGYDVLLKSLTNLPGNLHWHLTHIGGGLLLDELKNLALELNLQTKISWLGAQEFNTVIEHYQNSDIFVLASRIDDNGDRDGLPNVLMEAMTQKIACIASNISGIPELITHQSNGLLVESENTSELTTAIYELIISASQRQFLGVNGQQTVIQEFSLKQNIGALINKFK